MKQDNWEQITDIFEAALERPPDERERFLNEVCRDQSLRDEVRELLDSFEEDENFLEGAAIEEVAEMVVGRDRALKNGDLVGRYKVRATLGKGGMGEVFLAIDTELERFVALKILSPEFSGNSDRIRRFVQEAKSASALNHPNILTVYEIGQFNGLRYIATEYIKGETLRERQKREPLTIGEILDVAEQIAAALLAAHRGGIIHRDIKPENIMLREDGLVKVLDFGLAKLTQKASFSGSPLAKANTETIPGMVMGTVAYMSPEQARGKQTGEQTDIWSLGVVLYELIAGKQPFKGETNNDVIAAILTGEPDFLEDGAGLNGIVKKSLQKNQEARYQSIKELLADLQTLRRELNLETISAQSFGRLTADFKPAQITNNAQANEPTVQNPPTVVINNTSRQITQFTARRSRSVAWSLAVIALALTAIAGFGLFQAFKPSNTTESFQTMRLARLTASGNASDGVIANSPDGKYIAYVVREGEYRSLWVKQIATAANIRIVLQTRAQFGGIAFSRDGNYVYYSLRGQKGFTELHSVPVLGGASQKLIENVGSSITFSPEGNRIAFVRNRNALITANRDGADEQQIATVKDGRSWNLVAWSPRGETIVTSAYSPTDNYTYLTEIRIGDGSEKPLASPPWLSVNGISWLPDASALVIAGRDLETGLSQLWLMTHPEGKLRRITNDLNTYREVSLSADGKKIFGFQQELLANVWIASQNELGSARQLTSERGKNEGMSGVAYGTDGKIVYTARVAGTEDLWIINSGGSGQQQLTSNAGANFSPVISLDNRYLVFVKSRAGSANLWRMDLDGSNPKQLTRNEGISGEPNFSPDGKWVIYQFNDLNNKTTIWKVGIEGGDSIQLTDRMSERPVISPDGESFFCNYQSGDEANLSLQPAIIPISGGQPVKLLNQPALAKSRNVRWSADGRSLIYIDSRDGVSNLWSQPIDGGAPKQMTDFKSEQIFRFDFSPQAQGFAIARGRESSDIIMIENFR